MMPAMDRLSSNLRYILWKQGLDRKEWPEKLAGWLGCDLRRAEDLLEGEADGLRPEEKKGLAHVAGVESEDLQSADLIARDHVDALVANIGYLVGSLPHGGQRKLADELRVDVTTVSRWRTGDQRPARTKLKGICRHFGLPPGTDLESEPVFLSLYPVGNAEMKKWLHERIDHLGPDALRHLFHALRRLLK